MTKICSTCSLDKQLEDYQVRDNGKLRNECKSCRSQYQKEYYLKNKQRILDKAAKAREANPDYNREYYQRTKDKQCEQQAQRYLANREDYIERAINRKAVKLNAMPDWLSEEDRASIREVYDTCRKLTEATGVEHHVDHIVPLQGDNVCGLHVHWNLRAIPAKENLSKSNKHDDWN